MALSPKFEKDLNKKKNLRLIFAIWWKIVSLQFLEEAGVVSIAESFLYATSGEVNLPPREPLTQIISASSKPLHKYIYLIIYKYLYMYITQSPHTHTLISLMYASKTLQECEPAGPDITILNSLFGLCLFVSPLHKYYSVSSYSHADQFSVGVCTTNWKKKVIFKKPSNVCGSTQSKRHQNRRGWPASIIADEIFALV